MTDMTFESAMKAFFEYQMRGVYTAMPGIVMGVRNEEECRVDVKPMVNMVFPDWTEDEEHPTILSVPLIFQSSSTSAFTFPVKAGDTVWLMFSQVSMDVFKSGDGTVQPPNDYRRFDKRDAVAIPGIHPFGLSINKQTNRTLPHSTQDAVIVHNIGADNECEIRMKPTGEIKITSPVKIEAIAPTVNVTASTSATVSAPAIYATATTLATITAPIAAINAVTSATITSPLVAISASTSCVVTSPVFTWNGNTVAVV